MESLDLAVIGAGAAGKWVARAMKETQPDWSITLFERHPRSIDVVLGRTLISRRTRAP